MMAHDVLVTAARPVRFRLASFSLLRSRLCSVVRWRLRQPSRVALMRLRQALATTSARL